MSIDIDNSEMTAAEAHWQAALLEAISGHFNTAHARVDNVHSRYFRSLAVVARRHWQNKADVPADLLNIPRAIWRLVHRAGRGEPAEFRKLTGKEQAVAKILSDEVMDLSALQALLVAHLRSHPDYQHGDVARLQAALAPYDSDVAAKRLKAAVAQMGLHQDSSRDLLMFVGVGLLGRGISDKIAFGSASMIGMSAASSLYLGQQSAWGAMWAGWFGVPTWVAVSGAIGGFAAMVVATPVLAPLIEVGVNRAQGRRRLHELIDQVERELRPSISTQLWQYGSYLQFIPDLVAALRHLR
ncbi:Uncharacterised protein [Zhongshania aliphaticivorans]|uniref:Uncharacterized protein n=1 Tax=Zhongshania aliphaticivorans TaxID=1470434 RepID=A0A5S9PPV4_9GAMM|nr:hypothetical protein [Zhongshania aliphaticivorans]CAA0106326.1 Uncharacterised protein [Zhongshania aliphaticivorans]CAA0106496.1 Uncharacterised protein [Zhongshania aliphaticivorans]